MSCGNIDYDASPPDTGEVDRVTTSILLVDAQEMLREGLAILLDATDRFRVIGHASDGCRAVELAEKLGPDVTVMDACLPGRSGIEATRMMLENDPAARIVILSSHEKRSVIEGSLRAGAMAYVVKSASSRELFDAIDAVRQDKSYLSPAVTQLMLEPLTEARRSRASGIDALTAREREVLRRIGEGLANKEIAAELGISRRTVESHRASIMRKLGVHRASNLVRIAIREDLVTP
jgi:DNA-binding NarL/FixJ family response regulator